jgi:hypothetical protein
MGLDLLARQRPSYRCASSKTIGRLNSMPSGGSRYRTSVPSRQQGLSEPAQQFTINRVLARQYPHRRAEFRARAKQEGTAPDVARAIDDLLSRIFGSDDSRGMLDVAL